MILYPAIDLKNGRCVRLLQGQINKKTVFNKDPMKYKDAIKYNKISYDEVLRDNLRIMDLTAITLCKENNLPIRVFDIKQSGHLKDIVMGVKLGTLVSG